MQKTYYLLCGLLFLLGSVLQAQIRIDSTMVFQDDPAKKYSIYIPSSYDENTPNQMMLAFHPFNVNRWDSEAWCDTLTVFAETNDLLLICPDGGEDGKVDDPIDTAFTTLLLDSMMYWYNVDPNEVFVMGFSWGGRTTYTYGLANPDKFAGFMPIGAFVNGTDEIGDNIVNVKDEAFYVIHGGWDYAFASFFPVIDSLSKYEACIDSNLLFETGHTIDFPNRNEILTEGFVWLDSVACGLVDTMVVDTMTMDTMVMDTTMMDTTGMDTTMMDTTSTALANLSVEELSFYPNPSTNARVYIQNLLQDERIEQLVCYDATGKQIMDLKQFQSNSIDLSSLEAGVYFWYGQSNLRKIYGKLVVN